MDVDQQEEEEEETDEMQLIEAMMEVEPAKAITKLQAIGGSSGLRSAPSALPLR